MVGEPLGFGFALMLAARVACCVAYFGVGSGAISVDDLAAWMAKIGHISAAVAAVAAAGG